MRIDPGVIFVFCKNVKTHCETLVESSFGGFSLMSISLCICRIHRGWHFPPPFPSPPSRPPSLPPSPEQGEEEQEEEGGGKKCLQRWIIEIIREKHMRYKQKQVWLVLYNAFLLLHQTTKMIPGSLRTFSDRFVPKATPNTKLTEKLYISRKQQPKTQRFNCQRNKYLLYNIQYVLSIFDIWYWLFSI